MESNDYLSKSIYEGCEGKSVLLVMMIAVGPLTLILWEILPKKSLIQ